MQPSALIPSTEETNAEVLLWQGRYRAIFVALVGFSAVTLKWFDVISADSLFVERFGVRPLLLGALALMAVYLLFHRVLALYLQRAKRAAVGVVIAVIVSDVVVLLGTVALLTPPEHYERALLVCIFTVQFTQIFFGSTVTIANLVFITLGYTALIALAADQGALVSPEEKLWSLALYGIGVIVWVGMQGQVAGRMHALVNLFSRAQDGDFSTRFEERGGQMPDPLTVIGRAYNRMRDHLQMIVLSDPLSGCFNRRGLNQLAEREVARAVRSKTHLAVLAVDLDFFKRVNDEFGHLTGDEVIREVGELLRETAREADVVARFGGEEFTILAPDTSDEGALILAERVMLAFRAHTFRSLPPDERITASIGVATDLARDHEIAKTLLARADEALYVAKRNGRDCSVLWHAGMRAFDGTIAGRGRASVAGMLRISG
jgi:diguanylate cyclase (GGDEF)-like protein